MRAALLAAALAPAAAKHRAEYAHAIAPTPFVGAAPCDSTIPGPWTGIEGKTPLHDAYTLAWAPAYPAWAPTCASGGCGWSTGAATLAADNRSATIAFDSGVKLTGTVSADCTLITWDNDSSCVARAAPRPPAAPDATTLTNPYPNPITRRN